MASAGVAVAQVMPAPSSNPMAAIRPKVLSSARSEAVTPEQLEPENDQRGTSEGCSDDDPQRGERLILACRQPRQLLLHEVQLVHAVGIVGKVGHSFCTRGWDAGMSSDGLLNTRLPGATRSRLPHLPCAACPSGRW